MSKMIEIVNYRKGYLYITGLKIAALIVSAAIIGLLVDKYDFIILKVLLFLSAAVLSSVWPSIAPVLFFVYLIVIGTGIESGLNLAGVNINLLDIVFITTALPSILHLATSKKHYLDLGLSPTIGGIIIFIIFGLIVGVANGNDPKVIGRDLHVLGYAPVLYFWSRQSLRRINEINVLITGIICSSVLAAIKVIYIALSGMILPEPSGFWQANVDFYPTLGGQRIIPLGADTFFAISFIFTIGFLLWRTSQKRIFIYLFLLFTCFLLVGLLLTLTRGLWGATLVGCVVLLALRISLKYRQKRILKVAVGIFLLFLITVQIHTPLSEYNLGDLILRRFSFDSTQGSGTLSYRLIESQEVINSLRDNFLVGNGLGATFWMLGGESWISSGHTHSGWVWVLLKSGLIGWIFYYGALILCMRRALHLFRTCQEFYFQAIVANVMGGLCAFTALDVIVNRTASLEGAVWVGTSLGLVDLLSRLLRRHSIDQNFKGKETRMRSFHHTA